MQLSNGVTARHDRAVLIVTMIDYAGLVGAMLQMIRQNAAGRPPVLNKLLQVLTAVAGCERDPARVAVLRRHADRVLADAERSVQLPSDLDEVRRRHAGSWPSQALAPQLTRSPSKMAIQGGAKS